MDQIGPWLSLVCSVLALMGYELQVAWRERRHPSTTARSAHALLRVEWVTALSTQPGSEIVAVQTLRNSLMSATISASTAAIVLMGTLSLAQTSIAEVALRSDTISPKAALELMLLLTLFCSYLCSAMAMRYFNHAGFVMSLPVRCDLRGRREPMANAYIRRAGLLYSWGLRCFLFVAPLVAGILSPYAMPVAALALILVLRLFDSVPSTESVAP